MKRKEKSTVDLKIFCSQIHKEPNENQNEKAVTNSKKFSFGKGDHYGKFTNVDFLYLSFFSINGCSLDVNVSFPENYVPKTNDNLIGKDSVKNKDIKAINESL